jgi:hypothetical protein
MVCLAHKKSDRSDGRVTGASPPLWLRVRAESATFCGGVGSLPNQHVGPTATARLSEAAYRAIDDRVQLNVATQQSLPRTLSLRLKQDQRVADSRPRSHKRLGKVKQFASAGSAVVDQQNRLPAERQALWKIKARVFSNRAQRPEPSRRLRAQEACPRAAKIRSRVSGSPPSE